MNTNELILERILQLSDQIKKIQTQLNRIENKIEKGGYVEEEILPRRELSTKVEFDPKLFDYTKQMLDQNSIDADSKMIKKLYFDSGFSFEKKGKGYRYWLGNAWQNDPSGEYVKNCIGTTLCTYYLKVNNFETYSEVPQQFLENQQHIKRLRTEKYKTQLLQSVLKLIK